MSTSITTTPSVTPIVITVTDAQDLANAIMQINASPEGTYDVVMAPTGGNTITLDQDLPILNAGNANVTFEGGSTATTLSGQELYRGLFVQSGDVTVQNLTISDALAGGGDGGSGIAAGGGGAGLGGGLFVGAAATVSLNNVNFTNDVAAGGNGGDIDTTATAGGGGGGMGGAGGDAADASSQNILNVEETDGGYTPQFNTSVDTLVGAGGGGGGGGLGTTASGSSVLNENGGEGDAPGQASGGGGGGQTESYQKTYFYGGYSEYGTDTSPSTGGGDYGGGGGFGNSEDSGGGGGGIGGQTSANYNTGQTVVVDETSELESILDEVYTVAKIVVPIIVPSIGIAFALATLATDVTTVAESGGFTLADGVELGSDAINLFVSAKAASAADEGLDAAEDGSSLATDVRNLAADLKAYATLNPVVYTQDLLATFGSKLASVAAKQALKLAENTAMNLANGDPLGTSLAEAASHLVPLPGQVSAPTVTDSEAFVAGEPTAGGNGGFAGGGGGGAGVGGNGGFGGGGGGAGLPSPDEDFDGGDGGFGGGGGGGSLNAQGGTAGFGAGNGTNGYYYDPATGIYSPMPSQGGGGLGAGGGVFVQQGGTLTIGGNVSFSGNAAAGGIAYNSGLGLGQDIFQAGGGILSVDPSAGQTTVFGNLTDENASEAGYTADSVGLSIQGAGLVQLNGINTFSDQTLIGAQSVANAIAADPAGASSVVNGQLEITAGTTITSNIVLEAGATLIVDAGAVLIGSIDLSNIPPGEPYTLSIAPTATLEGGIILPNAQYMSASTIAGVDEILADFAAQTVAALPSQPYVLGLNSATDLQAASGTIHVPILPNDQPLIIQAEVGGGTLAASNLVLADPSKGGGGLILAETSAADTLTIDASISDANSGASAGTPGYTDITVAGPGTTVLAGNNSFDGGVTLQAGTLDIDGNAHVGTITFAPTGSSAAPVVLSMALSAVPTSFAYQVGDLDGAFSEAGTFDFNDPIELPDITAPGSPLYGQLTPNIGNDDINDVFGVDGGANALDPDFVELAAFIGGYGTDPSPFTSNFAAILATGSDGVATLSINPEAIEIRGFGSGTLTTGDSIEITNAEAPAQPMTLTSFAYNGDTLVAITLSNDTTGYIDFGTGIAVGTTFILQAGSNGVATLTLATTAFTVAQSSDLSNALTAVTAATQAGTTAQSFVVTDNAYQVTLSAQTTQLGMGDSLVIRGQGNEITTSNGPLTFDGPGTVAIGDATLNNVNVSSFVIESYGIEVGSGTTVDLDQVSVEQEGIAVDSGGVLNVASSTFTEPSGALYNAIGIEGGAADVTDSTISGTIEVTSGALTLGDDNVVSGAIFLGQTNATLFIDPAVGATDTIDGAIIGAGSVVIGAPSTANGGLVVIAGASDYSGDTTVYADETVDVDSGASLGTGTVTIVGDRTELPMLAEDATLVLDGGGLPDEIDVTAPAAVIDIAANSTAGSEATLSVASGSALTVIGNGATLDVSAASMGLDIAGAGTVTLEGITVTSTDGTALTVGDDTVGFGSGVTITGGIVVEAGASLDLVSSTISAAAGGTALDIEGGTADFEAWQITGAIVIAGGGTLTLGAGTVSGSIAIDAGSSLILSPTGGGTVTLGGPLTGDGTLTIDTPTSVPGGLVEVTGDDSFSGDTIIEGENILEIAAGASLGTGSVTLAGPDATLRVDGTTLPAGAINFSSGNGMVALTGLGAATFQTVAVNASGDLNFTVGSTNETLAIAGVAAGTSFDVVGVGGYTEIFLAAQTATVASGAAFEAAIDGADALPPSATGATYTIALAPGAGVLAVTQNENLASPATVQIVDAAGSGAPAAISVAAGVSLGLSGANSFAGGIEIGSGATVTLADADAAGTGAITFVGTGGAELVTPGIVNTIVNFSAGDTIDVTGVAATAGTVLESLQGTVTIPTQTGNGTYQFADIAPPDMPFIVASDGHGGTLVTTAYTQQVYTVSTEAELDAAIASINAIAAGSDIAATIDFAPDADIKLTQSLPTLTLAASTILYINGNGGTLDGQGAYQGFVVAGAGTLTVANINIVNAVAQGGNDYGTYGGGGGAGLGGALFIGGTTQATLLNIGFSDDAAVGGNAWVGNMGAGNGADAPSGVTLAGFGQGSYAFAPTNGWGGGEGGYLTNGLQDGGGGAGLGGAIFVQSGASVTVAGALTEQGSTAQGGGGIQSGFGLGAGIFAAGNGTLTFAPQAGTTIDIADAIADQSEPSVDVNAAQSAQVNVLMAGAGTLDLGGANSYGGTTTIESGTAEIADPSNLTGAIVDDSQLVFDPPAPSTNASLFPAGDQISFADSAEYEYAATIGGTGTLADLAAALLTDEQDSGYEPPAFMAAYGMSGVSYNAQTGVIQIEYYGTAPQIYDADGVIARLFEINQGPVVSTQPGVSFPTIDLTLRGAQTSFGQAITGNGDVTLDGAPGTGLTLTGSAAWTGSTTIDAGNELTLAGPNVPLGAIDDEGVVDFANTAAISRAGFLANGAVIFSGVSATLTSAITGSFALSVDATGTVTLDETPAAGALGAVTVSAGTLDLTTPTVDGPIFVSGGLLDLSGDADIAQNVTVSGGTLALSGGEVLAGDVSLAGGTLSLAADAAAATGTFDFTGSATLIVNADAMPTGVIQNFLPNDTIVATGFDAATFALSVNPTTDVMTLSDALGHAATLQLGAGTDPSLYTYSFRSTKQGIAITAQLDAPVITGFSDTGTLPAGADYYGTPVNAITGSLQQTITGIAAPGSMVTLYASPDEPEVSPVYTIVGHATADANGDWSIAESFPSYLNELGFQVYQLTATATQATGAVSALSAPKTLLFDTSTPTVGLTYIDASTTSPVNNSTFTITAALGVNWAKAEVLSGNQVVGSLTNPSDSLLTPGLQQYVDLPVTLTQTGANALSIEVTNDLGLSYTTGAIGTVTYDPQPAAPTVSLLDDTSGGHGITSNDTLVGTATPNSTVSDGYASATVGADGTFTLTQSLPDGVYKLQVTDTAVYGTVGQATPISFTLETTTPAPSAYFAQGSSRGDLSGTPLVTVSAEAGAFVSVSDDGQVLATGTASSAGLFTFDLPAAGTYTLSLTSTDIAGNTATATSAPLLYDPHVPNVTLVLAQETGVSGDGITDDGTVLGTADPNTTVTINEGNGVAPFTETTDGSGNFSFTLSPNATPYAVVVSDSSDTGVVGTSAPLAVLVQPASLDQPILQLLRISGTDGATNDPDLLVKADTGTTVTISDGSTVIGTVTGTGGFTTFDPTLADGTYALTAVATNTAGAISAASAPLDFTLETESNDSVLDVSVQSIINGTQAAQPVAFTVTGPTSSTQTYTVEFVDGNGDVVSGTARAGATSGTVSGVNSLVDGTIQILLDVTDQAGDSALLSEGTFLLDTTPDHGGALAITIDPTSKGVLGPADEPDVGFTVSGMDADASGVVVFTDGTNTVTESVASNGTYSANLSGLNGTISAVLTATDSYGNSAQASTGVTALITPPAAPIVSLVDNTGVSATDGITSDPALTVANVPTNGLVEYSLDDTTFSTAQPTFTTNGQKTVYVETVDQAGNVSAATDFSFTLDATPPAIAINDAAGDYTDSAVGGQRTLYGAAASILSGTTDPSLAGSTVEIMAQVYLPDGSIDPNYPSFAVGSGIVQANGSWTATIGLPRYSTIVGGVPENLPGGGSEIEGGTETALNHYSLTASVTDLAGNTGSTQTDYVTGTPPAVTLRLATDTGTSDTDGITNTVILTGTAEGFDNTFISSPYSANGTLYPGSGIETAVPPGPIEIYDGSTLIDTIPITPNETGDAVPFTVNVLDMPGVTIPDGVQTFSVVQTDAAGDVGAYETNSFGDQTVLAAVTVDVLTQPPVITASLDAASGPDAGNGYVQQAIIDTTSSDTVNFFGVSSGDSSLPFVYSENGVVIATSPLQTATFAGSGNEYAPVNYYSDQINLTSLLGDGTHTIVVSQTDLAGNVTYSAPVTFTLLTAPPVLTLNLADDTSNGQDITSNSTVVGNAGDATSVTVTIYDGTYLPTVTLTPDAQGNFVYTVPTLNAELGSETPVTVTAVATDAAGNQTTETLSFTQKAVGDYLAITTADGGTTIGADDPNVLEIIGAPGTVTITDQQRTLGQVTIPSDNLLTPVAFQLPTPVPDGIYDITAEETDVAGNVSTASLILTEDSHVPTVTLGNAAGVASDQPTNNDVLVGTADPNAQVALLKNTSTTGTPNYVPFATTTADASGNFSFTLNQEEAGYGYLDAPNGGSFEAVDYYAPTGTTGSATFDLAYYSAVNTTGAAVTAVQLPQLVNGVETDEIEYDVTLPPGDDGGAFPDTDTVTFTDTAGDQVSATGVNGFVLPTGLLNGTVQTTLTLADAAGNIATVQGPTFTLDATPPQLTFRTQGNDTNATSHTVYGTDTSSDAGQTVTIFQIYNGASTQVGTAVVAANGTWSLPVTLSSGDGIYGYSAEVTSPVGIQGVAQVANAFDLETAPPTVSLQLSNDTSNGNDITFDPEVVANASEAGLLTIYNQSTAVLTVDYTPGNGGYAFDMTSNGIYNLSATLTDNYGNTGTSAPLTATLDNFQPAAPVLSLADDTSGGAGITTDLTLIGSADPGDTVELLITDADGGSQATVTANSSGVFTFTPTVSMDSGVSITAYDTTAANWQSTDTDFSFTADVTPPTVSLALNDDTSHGAGITSDPTLAVTSKPNSVVTFSEGSEQLGSVTTNAEGFATFDPQGLSDGLQTITAQATDAAGLVGPATAFSFTLDTNPNPDGLLDLVTTGWGAGFYTYEVTDGSTVLSSATVSFSDNYGDTVQGQPDGAGTAGVVVLSTLFAPITATVTATDVAGDVSTVTQGDVFTLGLSNNTALVPGMLVTSAPQLYGYAVPGMTVSLNDGAGVIATTTADASSEFSFFRPSLANGYYMLTASGTDADGNTDSDQMNLVVFDTDTTGATISINPPSSTIGSDEFTVTGQASASEAGNIVYLEAPDYAVPNSPYTDVVGYGTIRGDGSWQVTAFETADGNYSFEAVVVAANGQQTASAAQSFVVQTAPANGVSITDGGATITGSSYDLTGLSSVAAGYIEIELGNGEYTLVQTDNSGNWSYDLPVGSGPGYLNGSDNFSPVVISPGLNSVTVSLAYDQNFNPISGTEATTTLTVVPPEPVPVITSATTDQGQVISSGEAITDPHVTFMGTAEDNSTVTIFDENDNVVGTVTASGSGNWTYDDTSVTLSTGDNYISATSVDSAGITENSTTDFGFTVYSVGGSAPAAPALLPASDSSGGLDITDISAVTVTGNIPVGNTLATVQLYDTDGTLLGQSTTNGQGDYTITTPNLAQGVHELTVVAINLYNESPASSPLTVTINTMPPTVTASAPAAFIGETSAAGAPVTFSESVSDPVDGSSDPVVYTEQLANGATQVVQSGDTFAVGTHTIVASATDTAGNTGTAAPFSFDVFDPSSTNVITFEAGNTGEVLDINPTDFTAGGQFLPIIQNFGSIDQIVISNTSDTPYGSIDSATPGSYDATTGTTTLSLTDAGSQVATLTFMGDYQDTAFFTAASGGNIEVDEVACYCAGTHILTSSGEKPVEELKIGELLVTFNGAMRPIKWIGRRSYGGRFLMGRKDILPICFKTGSLADNVPSRDLWISPHHAMCFEDEALGRLLIEASDLVNGVSIVQAEHVDAVAYFHIELESHDVIIAEGALSETFVDDDSRGMFHNAHEYRALYPDKAPAVARYCAPRLDHGYEVERARHRIASRAGLRVGEGKRIGVLRGYVDEISQRRIAGWAQAVEHPEAPVCLDICVDGVVIGQTLANRYREGLVRAGLGSGSHSFEFTPPHGFEPTSNVVEVRRSLDGTALLPSKPARADVQEGRRKHGRLAAALVHG